MKKTTATILLCVIVVALLALTYTALVGFPIGIYDVNPLSSVVKTDTDMQEGYVEIYSLSTLAKTLSDKEMKKAVEIFQQRLEKAGIDNATASLYGKDKIAVKFPIKTNAEYSLKYLGYVGKITFKNSDSDVILTEDNIKTVTSAESAGSQYINFHFDAKGTQIFAEETKTAAANSAAISILLDDATLASPSLNEAITTGTCSVNLNGADIVAAIASCEKLPAQFEITSAYTVSGTAGYKAIDTGLIASIAAVVIMLALLVIRYRIFSLASIGGLWLYGIFTIAILALNIAGITLSVPVIAAIIAGTVLALMTHVLIFESILAENKGGKPVRASVKSGYAGGIIAARYINYALFVSMLAVYAFGTLALRQFSVMLMFSILITMITTFIITRSLLKCFMAYDIKKPALFGLVAGKGGEK